MGFFFSSSLSTHFGVLQLHWSLSLPITRPNQNGKGLRGCSQVFFITSCYYRHLWKALFGNMNTLPLHGLSSTHCSLLKYFLLCCPSISFLSIHILNIHMERNVFTLFCSSYQESYHFSPDSLLMHNLSGQDPCHIIPWAGKWISH